jgi:hypothetical protein
MAGVRKPRQRAENIETEAPNGQHLDPEACTRYFDGPQAGTPQINAIGVLDVEGQSRCRSDAVVATGSFADRQYFQAALAAKGAMALGEYSVAG